MASSKPVLFGRYFWKLFLVNTAAMALVLLLCTWIVNREFHDFHLNELSRYLGAQATSLTAVVRDRFHENRLADLNRIAREMSLDKEDGFRVTFIFADGSVVGDSQSNPDKMESHSDRPEIREALATGRGESVRWSQTIAKDMKYVAVRVGSHEAPMGVVRVAMAIRHIGQRIQTIRVLVSVAAVVAVLLAIVLSLVMAAVWSRRVARISDAASNLSRGDLSTPVRLSGRDELALVGQSLERMRRHIARQVEAIDHHRRTLEALVSQLREGVVLADHSGRIVLLNQEAAALLRLTPPPSLGSFVGMTVEQCLYHNALQELMQATAEPEPHEPTASDAELVSPNLDIQSEVEVNVDTPTGVSTLLCRASNIRLPVDPGTDSHGSSSTKLGRVLVLTNITELARVMQVKADLAANASHELRTPIAAIRAATETLRSLDWTTEEKAARQFVGVIDRQSAAMQAMITDLLELSKLESGSSVFDPVWIDTREFLQELRDSFAVELSRCELTWHSTIDEKCERVHTSPHLVEMVLRNLIDNAIRFTSAGGEIRIQLSHKHDSMEFAVEDTGCGIAPEHQSRVFERFYQVESARSGSNRGTGLGLSIVRNACSALHAKIRLTSQPGKGTRVSIAIPLHLPPPNG